MKQLKSSSILAVPSRMESLPTNIKEAFFYKIPVVATNIGGIPELISNNHTGILTSSEDPDELSTKINHILKNQVYGLSITELTSLISRRSLYCSKYGP